jgi:hypothetical protein
VTFVISSLFAIAVDFLPGPARLLVGLDGSHARTPSDGGIANAGR